MRSQPSSPRIPTLHRALRAEAASSSTCPTDDNLRAGLESMFRPFGGFQPFLSAGYGVQAVKLNVTSNQDQVRLHGSGLDVGLGFDYFTHNRNSIGLGITERFIHYRKPADPRFREGLDSRSTFVGARWNIYF